MILEGSRVVAVVPARGGSVRIPGKNLEEIDGWSLVARAVQTGLAVPEVDEVVVSSDASEILAEGRRAGAVADERDPVLARSDSTSREVVADLLSRRPDIGVLVLLQPTSPLRTASDVVACLRALEHHATATTVSRTDHPSAWTRTLSASGVLLPGVHQPSPDEGIEVRLNGAVYVARAAHLRSGADLVDEQTVGVLMPRSRSIDVDDPFDLHLARLLAAAPFDGDDLAGTP